MGYSVITCTSIPITFDIQYVHLIMHMHAVPWNYSIIEINIMHIFQNPEIYRVCMHFIIDLALNNLFLHEIT